MLNTVKEKTGVKSIEGTWQYEGAACQFKSDDLLQKAGGIAMAEGMKTKLEAAYAKAGIVSGKLSYTFSADSTFTSQFGQKTFKGTYSYNASTGILTLNYYSLFRMEASVVKTLKGLSILFDDDRLLKFVTLLSGISDVYKRQGCTENTSFNQAFSSCEKLRSVPADIFDDCRKVTDFRFTFRYNTAMSGESPYTLSLIHI